MRRTWTVAGIFLATVVACARYDASAAIDSAHADSLARVRQDSTNRAQPGYVVDSIFPIEEEIRRFNAGLERPAALGGPAGDRHALVGRFSDALARGDGAALRKLVVARAEFGYLIFPESPYTRPPYKTKPAVIWTQLAGDTDRGLARLLDRLTGAKTRALRCDSVADHQGPNTYWRNCSVLLQSAQGEARMRLFGQILERDGHAKFLSYGGDF